MNKQPTYNFKLKTQQEDFIYAPEQRTFSFYQICQFPINKKYEVRKLVFDEFGELVSNRETKLKKEVLDKFLSKCKPFKYCIYPTYQLNIVDLPTLDEISTARSQILNDYVQ